MATTTSLARKFQVDVTADLTLAGSWIQLNGITDLKPIVAPNMQDTSAYDTDGWDSSEITSNAWSLACTFFRRDNAGVYDAGQELVRARIGGFGDAARVGVRWYDKLTGGPEAYQGVAIVKWDRSKSGVKDVEEVVATLTGDGILTTLGSNPYSPTAVPSILSATPSGVATGGIVEITGTGFTGTVATSGVKFGSTNATSWIVLSDQLIVAVMPTGTAGAANIVVTNATGASTAFTYARG